MAKIGLIIADKNIIFCEGLAKLLKSKPDFEVMCTCHTGLEAVESAHKHQPDVVLIDLKLSDCNSIEAIQHIHEGVPKTNIIVLTHSEADEDIVSVTRAGATAYLSKDVSIANLIKAITLVADGVIVVSPPMAKRLLVEFSSLEERKDAEKLALLLSKREQVVLSFVAQGSTNREIATTLVISENTVKVHLRNIMGKLHAHTRQKAVSLAGGQDLLPRVTQTDTKQA